MIETTLSSIRKVIMKLRHSFPGAEIVYLENSWSFYEIMQAVFPEAEPWMEEDIVVVKIEKKFYNISGEVKGDFKPFDQEEVTFIKKTRHEGLYHRITPPVPAIQGPGGKEEVITPDVVFMGYHYNEWSSQLITNERRRLAKNHRRRKFSNSGAVDQDDQEGEDSSNND